MPTGSALEKHNVVLSAEFLQSYIPCIFLSVILASFIPTPEL
jgi:hypothetical protein